MSDPSLSRLPPAQEVALGYARAGKPALTALFALDLHCAGVVRRTTEPMLAQMRLAWWRDALLLPVNDRPRGEPLLESLSVWEQEAGALANMVSAWEHLVGDDPLDPATALAFARSRAEGFAGFARLAGAPDHADSALRGGVRWALADLASHVSTGPDREAALRAAAGADDDARRLPPVLRPLAVLFGLAERSLARGGEPLLQSRVAALLAFRLGMFGR